MFSLQAREPHLPRRPCMHKISASHVSEGRCCLPHRQDVEITAGLTGASDTGFYFAPKAAAWGDGRGGVTPLRCRPWLYKDNQRWTYLSNRFFPKVCCSCYCMRCENICSLWGFRREPGSFGPILWNTIAFFHINNVLKKNLCECFSCCSVLLIWKHTTLLCAEATRDTSLMSATYLLGCIVR